MFDDIRPFRDDEAPNVIKNIINETALQESIAAYFFPRLNGFMPSFSHWLVKHYLKYRASKLHSVAQFQREVAKYLHKLVKKSSDGFSFNGLAELDMNKPTLFISNHRDIALDPALVNLALYKSGFSTVEIAIGDNLLSKPWVSDLMRINKSFIVKRNEATKRAMLTASKNLSSYIHHTLNENSHHVWIAQREGRAKDGLDKTNAALISMLLLNKDKQQSIESYLEQLNIVPVSLSYEFDPCDKDKANELATLEETGSYEKADGEDLRSITQGLVGYKGKIHLEFGQPIVGDFQDSKSVAAAIDQQIIANYKLFPSNISAKEQLEQGLASEEQSTLTTRLNGLNEQQKRWLLTMYANPAIAKEQQTAS